MSTEQKKHTIQSGETLTVIADMYDTTVDDIVKANPNIKDPNLIYAGDELIIPSAVGDTGSTGSGATESKLPTFDSTHYNDTDAGSAAYDAMTGAGTAVADYLKNNPAPSRESLDAIVQSIMERKPFTYDFNADALYHQYADQYMQKGKMAMQDTMGQAAAMTGGYGNSYAATAGNQAYQAYLGELNNIIPELYQMAYDRYNQEGQDMYNQYAMLSEDYATRSGEYWDAYGRLLDERKYNTDAYYAGLDAYNTERDTGNALTQKEFENALSLNEDDRAERTLAMQEEAWALEKGSALGNGGGTGGYTPPKEPNYDNAGYSEDIVGKAQLFVGASKDGKWGEDSAAAAKAAGYNSLEEVVKAMTAHTGNVFTGTTYGDAAAYLQKFGGRGATSGLMDQATWQRHKNSGEDVPEVTGFDTYKDYLEAYVMYAMSEYKD